MGKFIDMTGWIMKEHGVPDSLLTVNQIHYPKNKPISWDCTCECGNSITVYGDFIRSGHTKSCGCLLYKHFIDMTGWIMKEHGVPDSRITVIERDTSKKTKEVYWKCRCSCGKEFTTRGSALRDGTTKSCGCLQKEKSRDIMINICKPVFEEKHKDGLPTRDLSGLRYGKITVIDFAYKKNKNMYWNCKCDCGNFITISTSSLLNGTQSCGCIKSKGEQKIGEILEELNIKYIKEFSFLDLKDILPLRFDFAIIEDNTVKSLIEFQGQQHYDINNHYSKNRLLEHDQQKREYCKNHNIRLIEIPYYDLNKINKKYIEELIK